MKTMFFVNARIGLAIFFGVLGGPALALALRCVGVGDGLGLVTAALVGGSIAWIACDPLRLVRAVRRAVHVVCEEYVHWLKYFVGFLIMVSTFWIGLFILTNSPVVLLNTLLWTPVVGATLVAACLFTCLHIHYGSASVDPAPRPDDILGAALKYGNPIALAFWACILTFRLLRWILRSTPTALGHIGNGACLVGRSVLHLPKNLYAIAKLTFRYYHSTDTRICFIDAALFAGGAYWYGVGLADLVLWALAGAVFGIINYEVVSVRILKIAPSHFSPRN